MIQLERIEKIIDDIFNYRIEGIESRCLDFFNDIDSNIISIEEDKRNYFDILKFINMALENRDYLLLADIMKYEVIPFLKNLFGLRSE